MQIWSNNEQKTRNIILKYWLVSGPRGWLCLLFVTNALDGWECSTGRVLLF